MRRPSVLALTYHAIGDGPPPLCVAQGDFDRHAAIIARAGVTSLTVSEAGDAIRASSVPERAVVITFDDGVAGLAERAAPSLERHGLVASVFCVSDHVGGRNDWPSQPPAAPALALAGVAELRELVALGWEVGAHGTAHEPLDRFSGTGLAGELAAARTELEAMLGVAVRAFAYPYGIVGRVDAASLAEAGYTSGWATGAGWLSAGSPWHALPRVDAHYLRSPAVLQRVLGGRLPGYVEARRIGSAARRAVARTGAWAPR